MTTIHWFGSLMSLAWRVGHFHTMTAAQSSATFFHSVCQLVSTSASPKHPQSVMGSVSASQRVSGVMMSMTTSTTFDTSRRLMAKSRQMPRMNSTVARSTAAGSVSMSGVRAFSPIAVR